MPKGTFKNAAKAAKTALKGLPIPDSVKKPVKDNVVKPAKGIAKAEAAIAKPVAQPVVDTVKAQVQPQVDAVANTANGAVVTVSSIVTPQVQSVVQTTSPAVEVAQSAVAQQAGIIASNAPEPVAGLLGQLNLASLGESLEGALSSITEDPVAFVQGLLEGLNLDAITSSDLLGVAGLLEGLQGQVEGLLGQPAGSLPAAPAQLSGLVEDLGTLSDMFEDLANPGGSLPMMPGITPPSGAGQRIDNPAGPQGGPSVALFNSILRDGPQAFLMRTANGTARNNTGTELNDIDPAAGGIPQSGQTAPGSAFANSIAGGLGGDGGPLSAVVGLVGGAGGGLGALGGLGGLLGGLG